MSITEAIVLGLVQGLTEFLPVSSSGHLVLGQETLGVKASGITFEVMVHFATMLAIITAFWEEIRRLVCSCVGGLRALFSGGDLRRQLEEDADLKLALLIVLGSIPAAILGISLQDYLEAIFSNPLLVSCLLLTTGFILWITRYSARVGRRISYPDAILIGLAQALAILPGISRSGSTISTALLRGVDRGEAVRFSFLLALPAILGATLLKLSDLLLSSPSEAKLGSLAFGMSTAYVSGFLAIKLLLGIVRRGRTYRFSYYCWAIGIFGLVFSIL